MVDLEILKKFGLSAEDLKEKFNVPKEKRAEKINKLFDTIRSRIQGGRDMNLNTYHVYYAIDQAIDSTFNQITPTLLATLTDKDASSQDVLNTLKQWGMDPNEVIREIPDAKQPNKTIKKIDAPAFFKIVVPLVAAYIKIRWAKIVNDRRLVPLMKFEPVISDEISRLKCDTLTARIETMARQYGYFDTLKQAVFRMLAYSECLQFPMEEWHTQCAYVENNSPYQAMEEDDKEEHKAPDGTKVKKIVTKEGMRYHLPHSSRTYYDRAFFASTFNTDTGCTHAGYGRIMRWSDVMRNDAFYNKESIGFEEFSKWFQGRRSSSYWKNVFSGCTLDFPGSEAMEGAGGMYDNEKSLARWYSNDMADKPIFITEHFEKLIPKDHGLGEYPYEVWFRFVIAADDNVIYAAPLPYCPVVWYGYDTAEGRTQNASMALEVLPFQDQFTNLLTQLLLTTKQNLANVSFVDTDVIEEKEIKGIRGWGERWFRSINIIPTSFKAKQQKQGSDLSRAVISHKFPMGDTNSIMMSMRVILDTLERVLVMSSQEVGQSASHEQTREEVRHIASNTSTRVVFTGIAVDIARDAWKRQLYHALMAYGQPQVWAQVPMDEPMDESKLNALGFTVGAPYDPKSKKQYVKTNKTALAYESFASDRDGEDRINDAQTAQAMILMLDKVLNNQMLAPAVGAEQAIQILNQICKYLDFPRDFKLVNTGQTQTMQDQVMEALGEVTKMIDQKFATLQEDIQGALQPITEKNMEQDESLQQIADRLKMVLDAGNAIESPSMVDPPMEALPATEQDMSMAIGGL